MAGGMRIKRRGAGVENVVKGMVDGAEKKGGQEELT